MGRRFMGACVVMLAALLIAPSVQAIGIDFLGGASMHNSVTAKIGQYYVEPEWITRPFEDESYFAIRIRWAGHEIEWIHDKIYMAEDTANIKDFSISDGYNYLLYNLLERWGNVEARFGLGVIVAHPEGTIDGHYIGSLGMPSWRLGGLGGQVALGYRDTLWKGLDYIVEGKVTTAFVHATYPAPVHSINVPTSGYHLLFGAGYDF